MDSRTCALDGCPNTFETDNKRKKFCCRAHTNLAQVKAWRNRHRKKGGGGGGGGNGGGGGEPSLFDSINPVDSRAIYVPDTCYRTPEEQPDRKPSVRVSPKSSKAAA